MKLVLGFASAILFGATIVALLVVLEAVFDVVYAVCPGFREWFDHI